jgi:hypothetical protein
MTVLGSEIISNAVSLVVKLDSGTKDCDGKAIDTDIAYVIRKDDLENRGLARTGMTYGALVVPYKYHLTGQRDFTGGASLGGYLGYRLETTKYVGFTLTPVAFLGGSNISVGAQNLAGLSYGLGLIGTFKGTFQAGAVIGWDQVGKSAGYQYNGKPWLAVEIGYSFAQ